MTDEAYFYINVICCCVDLKLDTPGGKDEKDSNLSSSFLFSKL
jgi:hypothetical protein